MRWTPCSTSATAPPRWLTPRSGLGAFGAFNIAQALWCRVPAPDPAEAARTTEDAVRTVRQNVAPGSDAGHRSAIRDFIMIGKDTDVDVVVEPGTSSRSVLRISCC
ncbi:MAG: hypothetical protein JWL84_1140 [Rhodospirillales bacterium]|nr:hypothetical protein [Rhodospirillales bacterium]